MIKLDHRWIGAGLALTASIVIGLAVLARRYALMDTAYITGWLLVAAILLLTSYNLRKKLIFPPLLRSSTWLQIHTYVGLLSVVLFFYHTGLRLPSGLLEASLYLLFLVIVITGIAGLVLSRTIPRLLAARGGEVIFERIPQFRHEVRQRAEQLILRSVEETDATTLARFYDRRLSHFFAGRGFYMRNLFAPQAALKLLRDDLRSLDRYFNSTEREIAAELMDLIETKDTLDYHATLQGSLKGWLFIHIPMTYMLLVILVVHVALVYAFDGSAP